MSKGLNPHLLKMVNDIYERGDKKGYNTVYALAPELVTLDFLSAEITMKALRAKSGAKDSLTDLAKIVGWVSVYFDHAVGVEGEANNSKLNRIAELEASVENLNRHVAETNKTMTEQVAHRGWGTLSVTQLGGKDIPIRDLQQVATDDEIILNQQDRISQLEAQLSEEKKNSYAYIENVKESWRAKVEQQQKQIVELERQIDDNVAEYEAQESASDKIIAEQRERIAELEAEREMTDKYVELLQAERNEWTRQAHKWQHQSHTSNRIRTGLEDLCEQQKGRIAELEMKIYNLREGKKSNLSLIDGLNNDRAEQADRIAELEERNSNQYQQIGDFQEHIRQLEADLLLAHNNVAVEGEANNSKLEQIKRLEHQIDELEAERADMLEQIGGHNLRIRFLESDLSVCRERVDNWIERYNKDQERIRELEGENNRQATVIAEQAARIEHIVSQVDVYETRS